MTYRNSDIIIYGVVLPSLGKVRVPFDNLVYLLLLNVS
jgi:hypothetical protein